MFNVKFSAAHWCTFPRGQICPALILAAVTRHDGVQDPYGDEDSAQQACYRGVQESGFSLFRHLLDAVP